MIPLAKPIYDETTEKEMEEALLAAYRKEKWCLGETVYKFEEGFAKYCGTKYATAVNSGTAALQLSLLYLGAKNNNVITSTNSFIATANAIHHAGGIPRFTDIKKTTGNIDPKKIILGGAKGIVPVHIYGNPCNMDEIMKYKDEGLFVVEDACQAHGAKYNGKRVGSIGDVGCFSFYPSKNMTVRGDGGMIVSDNEELIENICSLRDCGRKTKYEHDKIGYTCRLNTINAAIGRVQLRYLDKWNGKRRKAAEIYKQNLPEEVLLLEEDGSESVYHMFVIKTEQRDNVIEHLKENDIQTGIHYPIPIHLQPAYKEFGFSEGDYPVAEQFAGEIVSLPMFPNITKDQVEFVCEKIMEVLE